MVSYYNPVSMFGRSGPGHHHHAPGQSPYFASAYSAAAATYHHPASAHHAHHHQAPPAPAVVTSSQFSPSGHADYNCNHTLPYHHQPFGNITPDSVAAAAAAGWHQPAMYSACAAARNMGYEDWTHPHAHSAPHPPTSFYHHPQPSPPSSTPSPGSTTGGGGGSPGIYSNTGPGFKSEMGFKTEFGAGVVYKTEFGPCSTGNPQENGSQEMVSQGGNRSGLLLTARTPHSPDSGMAVSDGVSSSGSPATAQHCLGGGPHHTHHQHHHLQGGNPNGLLPGSQLNLNGGGSAVGQQHSGSSSATTNSSGGSGVGGRPTQARSPYEWMKKPSYNSSSVTSNSGGKTRTKDKYRVVYSDTQRLELEKEFHYSRYITIRRKSELASILGLSERQVKIWFQNRRAKERKVVRKREEMIHREKIATMVHMQNAVAVANGGMSGGPGMCNQSNVGALM